jgi:hypothetical protein
MGRRLRSVGVDLLVSKFRIVPPPVRACDPPQTQSGDRSCRAGSLFNFIVDASDERRRQRNAKRPSSGEIDRQTKQVGLIDRQITRLCAFEDLVDIVGKAPSNVRIFG